MSGQRVVASTSRNSWMTLALTRHFLTNSMSTATNIASAVLASEQTSAEEIKRSVFTFATIPTRNGRLTRTLTRFSIASIQSADRAFNETVAFLTSMVVTRGEVPVQWTTFIANATLYSFLTLTQLARWDGATTRKFGNHASWVTITLLTRWIVVESFLAHVTLFAIKVIGTLALSLIIARNSN